MENSPISQETMRESFKFAIVGGSGVIVNFIVLAISLYLLGLTSMPESVIEALALALGIAVSMSTNYLFNRRWTFGSESAMGKEYLQYVSLNLIGSLIQWTVGVLLEFYFDTLAFETINLVVINLDTIFLASFIGILAGFVSNFLFSKYFVFN